MRRPHERPGAPPGPSEEGTGSLDPAESPDPMLAQLERRLAGLTTDRGVIEEALQELRTALEEIRVADEELAAQNEQLLTTREMVEAERYRFERLFETAPDSYLVTDAAGTILEANRAACELLNTSRPTLVGKPLVVFIGAADRMAFRSLVLRLGAGERVADWELVLRPRERGPVAAVLTAAPAGTGPDPTVNLLFILRDVSARKAAEEALRESEERLRHSQRLESIGRLAGGIAHSFNNLLAAIAFHCELLGEGLEPGSPLGQHLDEIQRAGERAAVLASQLLAFSRKQVLQPEVLPVNDVLAGLEGILGQLLGETITLALRLDPDAGAAHVDLGQLEQVILNLVTNARDAMPDGGTLTLTTSAAELTEEGGAREGELPPGRYVQLVVTDTGMGMTDEVKTRLFEPFFTTKERHKGTGLGLATVYGIVRQSGGDIRFESELGQGSRFAILLPRATEPAIRVAWPQRRAPRRAAGGSEVILLVEDADNIREPALEVLEGRGYKVLAARDGNEALALAARHRGPIHLLVSDVIMPGMNGSQLAGRLQESRPEVQVLFMSGYPEDAIARHGVLEPRRSFLQKPFSPQVFLSRVREMLDAAPGRAGAA